MHLWKHTHTQHKHTHTHTHTQEPAPPPQPPAPAEDMEMEMDMEEEEEPIRVVKNYVRPAPTGMRMLHGQVYDPTKFAVSPITGACVVWWLLCAHVK